MKIYLTMKNYTYQHLINFSILLSAFIVLSGFSNPIPGDRSANGGEMSFTVRTVTANGNFSPKHVLAIWIEDTDGFVKSRKVMANQRKQYLYTWVSSSNNNVVDAITGPTLTNHQTHTVEWDCKDLNGNIVPDGEYVVYAEFTDKHAQGPLYSINFTKGPDPVFVSPPDETYFKDIVITFTPYICEFSASETELCEGYTVTFTDESVNASSWEWDFGEDAVPATASTEGPHQVHYNSTGKKDVSLSINGSVTETKLEYINVSASPTADFNFSGSNLTVNFQNTSVNANNYFWDLGDGNTSNVENPTHVYASSGTYSVTLLSNMSVCYDTIVKEVMVPLVGVHELDKENLVNVFPNPNTGKFYIDIQHKDVKTLRLIDISGQLIKSITPENNNTRITVELEDSSSGIYFLEIVTEYGVTTKKVFIK